MKIYLLFNGQRIAKKKTHVKKRTLNPVFNESFVFELPHMEEGLKNISLEFMLLDWDRVTKNEVIFSPKNFNFLFTLKRFHKLYRLVKSIQSALRLGDITIRGKSTNRGKILDKFIFML